MLSVSTSNPAGMRAGSSTLAVGRSFGTRLPSDATGGALPDGDVFCVVMFLPGTDPGRHC
jgi:hypothetical protein